MCWSFNFGFPGSKTIKDPSSIQSKRQGKPIEGALHGKNIPLGTGVSEKRGLNQTSKKRRSGTSTAPRTPRREREGHRQQYYHHQDHDSAFGSCDEYQPALNAAWPEMYSRSVVQTKSASSSQETLLNPRPHRSQCTRQRHPERTSQTTLRGRGAKRVPLRPSKSKNLRPEPSRGWSLFAPSPPMPKRQRSHRDYQGLEASPRIHLSSRARHSTTTPSQTSPESSRSQAHNPSLHRQEQQFPASRPARSHIPNTATRRAPDRRFAVLAATNQALENVRREAFAQPSPPPRRERLRRYEGVSVPTNRIPFNWDCVSSSRNSAIQQHHGEPSRRR